MQINSFFKLISTSINLPRQNNSENTSLSNTLNRYVQTWGRIHTNVIEYEYEYIVKSRIRIQIPHLKNVFEYEYITFQMNSNTNTFKIFKT